MPLSGERTKGQEIHDFAVLTSAALPWMTGPSFISLWHACGLATLGYRVVYVLPWLDEASQQASSLARCIHVTCAAADLEESCVFLYVDTKYHAGGRRR